MEHATEGALRAEAAAYGRETRLALGRGDPTITLDRMLVRAFGEHPVQSAPMKAEVIVGTLHRRPVIVTSDRLSPRRARWCVAHAFAGWLLERDGHPLDVRRRFRAALAAELLLPLDVCLNILPQADVPKLAEVLTLPLSFALLREGEVLRKPTALVVPGVYARVLGDDEGRLPAELAALELLASRRGIGVQRWDVPEDRGVVVRVAA